MQKIAAWKASSSKEREKKGDGSGWNDSGLIIIGKRGEKEISHQKKVQKLKELIAMRVARKKRLEELMEKRAGVFC